MARFYAVASPAFIFNLAARQIAAAEGNSSSQNARALALLNMASNDSLVVSFWTKYRYNFWRPETAIHEGSVDGNAKTDGDIAYVPYIVTPCFPSYPSNHGSGSNSAAEILRRIYGSGGHDITIANHPAFPGVVFHYTRFNEITDDISDARVYGGIHFRFDQDRRRRSGTRHRDLCVRAQPSQRKAVGSVIRTPCGPSGPHGYGAFAGGRRAAIITSTMKRA